MPGARGPTKAGRAAWGPARGAATIRGVKGTDPQGSASGASRSSRGRFLVVDGLDGCGKSSQARRLVEALAAARGRRPLHLREPGGTPLGEALRGLLLSRTHTIGPAVETLLFAAARRQMLDERVAPALAAGDDVVCERFHPATLAYQAYAGGLDPDQVLGLLGTWAGSPAPDLVLLLDLEPELAALRRGPASDRIEDKGLEFQRAVRRGFQEAARRLPRVRVVDASGDEPQVARAVWAEVARVL